MKYNKLYTGFLLLAASLMMVSCSEYEDAVEESEAVSSDNPGVRFSSANASDYELETDDLNVTLTIIRDSSSTAALEVTLVEVSDTANVFEVPTTASFAANEFSTTITVTMDPDAVPGDVYGLQIEVDNEMSNPYLAEYSTFYGEIAISIWTKMGTTQVYDYFCFYSVAEVIFWQNSQDANQIRISSPYTAGILTEAEWGDWIGGTTQDKIVFTIAEDKSGVTWDEFWYSYLLYDGVEGDNIKAYLPSALSSTLTDELNTVSVDSEGNIEYLELHPYWYVDGLGGWGTDYPTYIGFPGFDLAGALGLSVYTE